jgi:hypothetical protein
MPPTVAAAPRRRRSTAGAVRRHRSPPYEPMRQRGDSSRGASRLLARVRDPVDVRCAELEDAARRVGPRYRSPPYPSRSFVTAPLTTDTARRRRRGRETPCSRWVRRAMASSTKRPRFRRSVYRRRASPPTSRPISNPLRPMAGGLRQRRNIASGPRLPRGSRRVRPAPPRRCGQPPPAWQGCAGSPAKAAWRGSRYRRGRAPGLRQRLRPR